MKKIKAHSYYFALLGIFLVSLFVRVYQLGKLPMILNRDEAALAYNAKLITESSKDEWGRRWPLSFESFGDYKLPGYIYSLSFLFTFLPQLDWVVKLPSLLAGALLPLVGYYFARSLKFRSFQSFLFALLLATTPVFFFYSRIAFEANLALSLFIIGLSLILRPKKQKIFKALPRWGTDLLGVLFFLLAVLTYNTPLLLLVFLIPVIIWLRKVKKIKTWILPSSLLILLSLIAGWQLLALASQKSGITIFGDETVWMNSILYRQKFQGVWQALLGNRYAYYLSLITQNYLKSFSYQFLVKGIGGHPWHSLPGFGHIFFPVYIAGLVGIGGSLYEGFIALKNKKISRLIKVKLSLLYLTLIALLPSVVTVDAPHATRSLFFFFVFTFMAVLGLKYAYNLLSKDSNVKEDILLLIFMIWIVVSSSWYLFAYFSQTTTSQASLRPGLQSVIKKAVNQYPNQDTIAVVDPDGYDYILWAWYLKLPAEKYFKTNVRQNPDQIGFRYGERVDRYHFIAQKSDVNTDESIIIYWDENTLSWSIIEL